MLCVWLDIVSQPSCWVTKCISDQQGITLWRKETKRRVKEKIKKKFFSKKKKVFPKMLLTGALPFAIASRQHCSLFYWKKLDLRSLSNKPAVIIWKGGA